MKIVFLGGAETVTGSRFLLETARTRVLVDCGLFQGYKWLRERNWQSLPFAPGELDAVLVAVMVDVGRRSRQAGEDGTVGARGTRRVGDGQRGVKRDDECERARRHTDMDSRWEAGQPVAHRTLHPRREGRADEVLVVLGMGRHPSTVTAWLTADAATSSPSRRRRWRAPR